MEAGRRRGGGRGANAANHRHKRGDGRDDGHALAVFLGRRERRGPGAGGRSRRGDGVPVRHSVGRRGSGDGAHQRGHSGAEQNRPAGRCVEPRGKQPDRARRRKKAGGRFGRGRGGVHQRDRGGIPCQAVERRRAGRMADLCGNAAGRAVRGACGDADKRGDEFAGGSVCTGKEKQARRCTGRAAKREQRSAPVYAGRSAGDERAGGERELRCDTGIHGNVG